MSIYKKYVCHTLSPEHSHNIFCLLKTKKQEGFTLAELLVAVLVIGALAAIAIPAMAPMLESAQHKKAAREIASLLRETRSRAISENLEHEVSFDLTKNCCSVRRGDRSNGTAPFTSSPASWTLVSEHVLSGQIKIRGNLDCNETTSVNFTIQFNPDGTGNSKYLCIVDRFGVKKFAAGVSSSTTGRVRVRRWESASSSWEK